MIDVKVFGSGSSGNSYLIDDGHTQLMLECGVRFAIVQEKMGYDFSSLAGVLISHEHRDHCRYIKSVIDGTTADIFATKGTIEAMYQDSLLKLKLMNKYRFRPINYKRTAVIGSWRVTPFETKHDVAEPCGFLIDNTSGDRLVFITDSYYVKYKFNNVSHMMIEMNYSKSEIENNLKHGFDLKRKERLLESHFDYENSLEFIKANKSKKLQEVWLIHLSETNGNPKLFKEETQKVTGVPVYIA